MFNKDFRPRRLRTSDTLRRMVRETRISADSLIWPIFIIEGEGICDEEVVKICPYRSICPV